MRLFLTLLLLFGLFLLPQAVRANSQSTVTAKYADTLEAHNFLNIRRFLSHGDLKSASVLTDTPDEYLKKLQDHRDRIGSDRFIQNYNQVVEIEVASIKHDGDYSVMVMPIIFRGQTRYAAKFYKKQVDGSVLEIVKSDSAPCSLIKHFYEVRGEPDVEISGCS